MVEFDINAMYRRYGLERPSFWSGALCILGFTAAHEPRGSAADREALQRDAAALRNDWEQVLGPSHTWQ